MKRNEEPNNVNRIATAPFVLITLIERVAQLEDCTSEIQ